MFNLTMAWGVSGAKASLSKAPGRGFNQAYGHLGATYGYQSSLIYFPAADVSLAVASNIETDNQVQPTDVACHAYHAVLAALYGWPEPTCTYTPNGYFGGTCDCGNSYYCSRSLFGSKRCVKGGTWGRHGDQSLADCQASCK